MKFEILTDKERELLRLVETSEEDARQIIKRCTPLLKFVESLPTTLRDIKKKDAHMLHRKHSIGCPHCGDNECPDCKWDVLNKILPPAPFGEVCLSMPFGGITLSHVMAEKRIVRVNFSPAGADVCVFLMDVVDAGKAREYRKDIREAKRFLKAHIEWGEGRLDGTL